MTCTSLKSSILFLGMLQIQFLAGAVGVAIQQHSEDDDDEELSLSQLTLFPCCLSEASASVIHIMWVRMTRGSKELNHIVPLLPEGTLCSYR